LIIAIDERNATEDNDSKNTSEFFNKIDNSKHKIEQDFVKKTAINKKNIISVVFPFYKEVYNEENVSHRVVLPLIINAPEKLLNQNFKKSLTTFDKIITSLSIGKDIDEIKNELGGE